MLHASGVVDYNDIKRRLLLPMLAVDKVASNTSKIINGDLNLDLCDNP